MDSPHPPVEYTSTNNPRTLKFVRGWREIANTYGTTIPTAKEWYDRGAPIVLLGKTPVAEAWELWCWLREEYG